MGISTMKFLVVLALFAAAAAEPEAEADPWYYYTHGAAAVYHPYTYGYGYPYYQYAVPAVKAAEKVEEVVEAKATEMKTSSLHPPICLWWILQLPIRLQLCPSCTHRRKTIQPLRQQWWRCPCC